jgi:hypothetical protein
MSEPTLRERMAVLETLMKNHIAHHEKRDQWMMRILGGLVIGVILFALPGCIELLGGIGV